MKDYVIEKQEFSHGEILTIKHDLEIEKNVPMFCCGLYGVRSTWCCITKELDNCRKQPFKNCKYCTCPNRKVKMKREFVLNVIFSDEENLSSVIEKVKDELTGGSVFSENEFMPFNGCEYHFYTKPASEFLYGENTRKCKCGSIPKLYKLKNGFALKCKSCRARTGICKTQEKAIIQWNRLRYAKPEKKEDFNDGN